MKIDFNALIPDDIINKTSGKVIFSELDTLSKNINLCPA